MQKREQVIQAALESRDSESRFVNEQRMEELMERSAAVLSRPHQIFFFLLLRSLLLSRPEMTDPKVTRCTLTFTTFTLSLNPKRHTRW